MSSGAIVDLGTIADAVVANGASGTAEAYLRTIKDSATSTTPSTVNITQVAGASISQGHGTAAAAIRVELPTDGTGVVGLNAGTNTIGGTVPTAAATGGATAYHVIAAASDNHANIKNGAGTVYSITGTSIHTTYQYVRLYNAATGFNGCNSATGLIGGWLIPGATTGAGGTFSIPVGLNFSTGISICITGAFSDTDTTSATASVLSINVAYQ